MCEFLLNLSDLGKSIYNAMHTVVRISHFGNENTHAQFRCPEQKLAALLVQCCGCTYSKFKMHDELTKNR